MSKPNRPALTMPPPRGPQNPVPIDKLASANAATDWAQDPAHRDAATAGLAKPIEASLPSPAPTTAGSPVQAPEEAGAGQGDVLTLGKPLKALAGDQGARDREIKHLVRIKAELNARLEALVDQIPRASKAKLVYLAIEQFVERTEKQIAKQTERSAG